VLLHGAAVLLAALVVTLGLFAVMARNPLNLTAASSPQHRLTALVTLGLVIGAALAFITALRERQVADRARHDAHARGLEKQVLQARLQLLQAQVEPHFLFNTLASVQRLVAVDAPAAMAMLDDLNQYLRASLPDMRESDSTVGREADMARAYLSIMRVRLGDRLSYRLQVPDALREESFPPMMLLSLIENAVEHGLGDRASGHISVSAHSGPGWLALRVHDDGNHFNMHAAPGVGLTNIRERLDALYGPAGRLSLELPAEGGLAATLHIPHDGNERAPTADR
jgi:sensor histidine kinase YesM